MGVREAARAFAPERERAVMPGLPTNIDLTNLPPGLGSVLFGTYSFEFTGCALSAAGDLNGDGFNDYLIGARGFDGALGGNTGGLFVVFGTAGGLPSSLNLGDLNGTNGFRLEGYSAGSYVGYSVSSGGDINGDGVDDLVVGAPGADFAGGDAGGAYVVYGKTDPFAAVVNLGLLAAADGILINGATTLDRLGRTVATGDINGDGFTDVAIGSLFAGGARGAVWVVFGADGGIPADIDLGALDGTDGFRITGANAADRFGCSVAMGDINGDGIDELIVGASTYYNANYHGAAYVLYGTEDPFAATFSAATIPGAKGWRIDAETTQDQLGYSVGFAGDVDGDGYGDLIVGAKGATFGGFYTGSAYVIFGDAASPGASFNVSSLNGTNGFRIDGTAAYDAVGLEVSGAGDINGDGFDDVVIGSFRARHNGMGYSGTSWVVFGGTDFDAVLAVTDITAGVGMIIEGGVGFAYSGAAVGGGDLNGDGVSDLLIGATGHGTYTGRAYVIYGRVSATAAPGGGTLNGGAFDDQLTGAAGKDILSGGAGDDALDGGDANDTLLGGAGADDLLGGTGNDILDGGGDDDELTGGTGSDKLFGGLGADTLTGGVGLDRFDGGGGDDTADGGADNDYLDGGAGADDMTGGTGNDVYIVDNAGDAVHENGGEGFDIVRAFITIATLADNVEGLELQGSGDLNGTGNGGANNLQGNGGANTLDGGAGVDTINGNDGDDVVVGGLGNDLLRGGLGGDIFTVAHAFGGVLETDQIYDFSTAEGDTLDLSAVDANGAGAGDGTFVYAAAFTKVAGQMTLTFAAGVTTVRFDVNGDAKVDYQVKINGDVTGDYGGWAL
ncbi:MAG: Ca2+-binding protein toxin-related [Caulobacter sp.]|nr:Ca2+-binding protein toxin-related [Caulobacter sp.]